MGLVVAAGLAPEPLLTAGCSWCQGAQSWHGAPGPAGCPPLPSALWATTLPAECSSEGFSPFRSSGASGFPKGARPHFRPEPMPLRTSALVTHTALQGASTDRR